jgi:3-isopropylmalate/(R)-2-methylmalate dehydratase small subunit
MIIPADYLKSTSSGGYGTHLFQRLRDGEEDFPLNNPLFKDSKILIAQDNFGCGSSREHAVWALLEHGIQVIIAPSFADIFFSNAGKNGLITIVLPYEEVQQILELSQQLSSSNQELIASIDLEKQKLDIEKIGQYSFKYDPFRKDCIINGLDDLDYIISHTKQIDDWKMKREGEIYYRTDQSLTS